MNTPKESSLHNTVKTNSRAAVESVHRGIDHVAETLHNTAENAAASATRLADRADRGAEALSVTQRQARATVLNYSRRHPWRALAVGLGAGFVLAKLTSRRMHQTPSDTSL